MIFVKESNLKNMLDYMMKYKMNIIFNICLIGIFILPYGYVGIVKEEYSNYEWEAFYVYHDITNALCYIVLWIMTITFQVVVKSKYKSYIMRMNLILCMVYSLNAIIGMTIPSLDYISSYGHYLTIILSPLMWLSYREHKKMILHFK